MLTFPDIVSLLVHTLRQLDHSKLDQVARECKEQIEASRKIDIFSEILKVRQKEEQYEREGTSGYPEVCM